MMSLLLWLLSRTLEEATQPALPELQPSPAIVIAKFCASLLELLLSPQLLASAGSRSALSPERAHLFMDP